MRKKQGKVFAFIDSQNLNLGVRASGWELDFGKFRNYLKDKYNVEKAFLFIGYVVGNEDLYTQLQSAGYVLVFKPVIISPDNKHPIKGNVDAELVLHAGAIEYDNFEKAILVSGDGDFGCLVKFLSEKDKLLKVIVPNNHYSSLLRKYAEFVLKISSIKSKVRKQ